MKNILILLITFFSISLCAQETNRKQDILFLKDGSTLRGTILEQVPDAYVKIKISGGSEVEILMDVIEKIKPDNGNYSFTKDGSNYRIKGLYKTFHTQAMLGKAGNTDFDERLLIGVGSQFEVGYQFNNYFGAGVGVGLNLYDVVFGDVYVNLRSFLTKGKVSPMVSLDAGYGVPVVLSGIGNNASQSVGGWSLRPNIGLRIATRNKSDILLDAGYQFQEYHQYVNWGWGSKSEYNIWYKRLSFRIGWSF